MLYYDVLFFCYNGRHNSVDKTLKSHFLNHFQRSIFVRVPRRHFNKINAEHIAFNVTRIGKIII